MTHSNYREELYLGQQICIASLGIGTIREINENAILVKSILTGEEIQITYDQAHLLKVDLKRVAIRNAVGLMSNLPNGFTIAVEIRDLDGKIVF